MAGSTLELVHAALTAEDDGRVCRDIPESACEEQPRNFAVHVASLASTKTGDGLADPKLVLSWLLAQLGTPAGWIGLLIPVREAGALLPQLAIAGWVRRRQRRKWVWAGASAVQGLAVLGMATSVATLDGPRAGVAVVGLLAVFAVARSFASVSYKDVLGKTVSKSTRGTATGTASTLASALVLAYGVGLATGVLPLTVTTVAFGLAVAGGAWLVAAALFTTLEEAAGATEGGGDPWTVVRAQLGLLREDPQLVRFVVTRSLLVATALAPPYLIVLGASAAAASGGRQLGSLGPVVIASSVATLSSSYVWGRLADRSSRRVLQLAGLVGALPLAAAAVLAWLAPELAGRSLVTAGLLFVLTIGYQGVRLGRSTHVVDMAAEDTRAAYTALSNTLVGGVLLASGAVGLLAQAAGTAVTLAVLAALSLAASVVAQGLEEVQRAD